MTLVEPGHIDVFDDRQWLWRFAAEEVGDEARGVVAIPGRYAAPERQPDRSSCRFEGQPEASQRGRFKSA
jgi:hypothetical protein